MMWWLVLACASEQDTWWHVPIGYEPPPPDTAPPDTIDIDTTDDQKRLYGDLIRTKSGADVFFRYVNIEAGVMRCDIQYSTSELYQVGTCGDCLVGLKVVQYNGTVMDNVDGTCEALGWDAQDGVPLYIGINKAVDFIYCTEDCEGDAAVWVIDGEAFPNDDGFEFILDL